MRPAARARRAFNYAIDRENDGGVIVVFFFERALDIVGQIPARFAFRLDEAEKLVYTSAPASRRAALPAYVEPSRASV